MCMFRCVEDWIGAELAKKGLDLLNELLTHEQGYTSKNT